MVLAKHFSICLEQFLKNGMQPFVVCGSGINCSNVFTVIDKMMVAKEKATGCSYARQKPGELYEEPIHTYIHCLYLKHGKPSVILHNKYSLNYSKLKNI